MAAIEIVGDDNHVLINDEYKNMILVEKKKVYFEVSPWEMMKGATADVTYTSGLSTPPILALNSGFPVVAQSLKRTGNTYIWNITAAAAGRGGTCEAYIFHLPDEVPDAHGLVQIRNENSVLVFDTNLEYAKVERSFEYELNKQLYMDVPADRKYAAVTSSFAGEFGALQYPPLTRPPLYGVAESHMRGGFYMTPGRINTNTFLLTHRTYAVTNPVVDIWRNRKGILLVLDVTGMKWD